MKAFCKFAMFMMTTLAVSTGGFSQEAPAAAKPLNLERGVVGPVSTSPSWAGYSALNLIPGAGLIPISTQATVFYLGFTAGTAADVSNMVLYTTPRNSSKISAVTPVTYGGVSNPSINLSSKTVCAVPPSSGTPCIVRLDPLTLVPSALSDYYLVVYFTASDSNNTAVGLTQPSFSQSSLRGTYMSGDESRLTVGQSLPSNLSFSNQPYLLMYVMTN